MLKRILIPLLAAASLSHSSLALALDDLGQTSEAMTEYSEAARKSICSFPDSEIKRALLFVPEFVVERNS